MTTQHSASERDSASVPAEQLVAAIVRRDESAFAELYRRFAPGLYALAYEILGDQRDAEDALQDGFVQMWKRAETYEPRRSAVFTWAVMIVRHKAIDRLRARQRSSNAAEVISEEFSGRSAFSEALTAEQREEGARVAQAVRALPEDQRQAIHLAFFKGLSHSEIAREIGTPLGTIKARIRRGLLALKEGLR